MFVGVAVVVMVGVSMLRPSLGEANFAALVFFGSIVIARLSFSSPDMKPRARNAGSGLVAFGSAAFGICETGFGRFKSGWLLAQRRHLPEWAMGGDYVGLSSAPRSAFFLLQPDVGQSALLTAAFMVTFFVSGLPWRWAAIFVGRRHCARRSALCDAAACALSDQFFHQPNRL